MQRRKKQLLGLVGLALIAAITAIAFAIPNPEASAAGEGFEHGVGVTVEVKQKPIEGMPAAQLVTPVDKFQTVKQDLTITFDYENADASTTVTLEKYGEDGETVVETLNVPVDSCNMYGSGQCTIVYSLPALPAVENPAENANFGVKYKLTVTPKWQGQVGQVDNATIFQRPMYIKYDGKVDTSTNDPYVSAYVGADASIEYALVQVYDKTTKQPIFMNGTEETPIKLTGEQIANAGGDKIEVLLPLSKYNLNSGEYFVTLVAFGKDGSGADKVIAISSTDVPYSKKGSGTNPSKPGDGDDPNKPGDGDDKPGDGDTPEIPDTGSIFQELNISRADYLIVGILAFGLVTGFAIFLIVRRNKR